MRALKDQLADAPSGSCRVASGCGSSRSHSLPSSRVWAGTGTPKIFLRPGLGQVRSHKQQCTAFPSSNLDMTMVCGRWYCLWSCRSGPLCYPGCREDYAGEGPLCWKDCQPGYKSLGPICCRSILHCYAKAIHGRGFGKMPHCAEGQQADAGLCYTHCRADYRQAGPVCIPKSGTTQCSGAFNTSCGAFCSTSADGCAATAARLGSEVWEIDQAVLHAERDCSLAWLDKDPMRITACIFDVVGTALRVKNVAELFGRC